MNKLSDAELKAHKKAMDVGFEKNAIKKGDAGFQYDKRVNFKYKAEEALDNSWDEDDEESDDDGVEVVASSQVKSKPKGVGLLNKSPPRQDPTYEEFNDNDYFDDDFDDDFQ